MVVTTEMLSVFDRRGLLVVLAIVIALMRLHTYDEPLERDITLYAVIAHEMLAGRDLYSDLWDHKPPAIYLAYAAGELLGGYGRPAIYLLTAGMSIVTLLGIWYAARRVAGDPAAVPAVILWTVLSGNERLQANQPNTEVFINALLIWAVAVLLDNTRTRRLMTAGALFAIASLFKHVAAFPAAFVAIACAWAAPKGTPLGQRLRPLMIVASSGAVMWALVYAYFAATGRAEIYAMTMFTSNAHYAGDLGENLARGIPRLVSSARDVLLPLLIIAIVAFIVGPMDRTAKALMTAYCLGVFLAVSVPGRFYQHYYQLWLPPLIVAFGVLAARLVQSRRGVLAAGVMLLVFAINESNSYRRPASRWSKRKYGTIFLEAEAAAAQIRALPGANNIYVWGNEPTFYFDSGVAPVTGVVQSGHLYLPPHGGYLSARVLADLKRRPPNLVIVNSDMPTDHDVYRWATRCYTRLPLQLAGPFSVWRKTGTDPDCGV